ncbi:unnamed protein product, partial [marine sediment metagenome]
MSPVFETTGKKVYLLSDSKYICQRVEGKLSRKRFSVQLEESDKLILETLAMRRKLKQKEIVGYYIQIDKEYDLFSGDWKARLEG